MSGLARGVIQLSAALFITFLLGAIANICEPPSGSIPLPSEMRASLDGKDLGKIRTPALFSAGSDSNFHPGIYSFAFELDAPALGGDMVLVFPHISGSSLSVSLNGAFIGGRGDTFSGRSTIWNSAHIFPVPANALRGHNLIVAEINGTYEAGVISRPYLTDARTHGFWLFSLMFLTNYLIWISIGGLLAVSIIVLSMGFFEESGFGSGLFLGVSGILAALLLTDFAYIERLPFSLVLFKRLVVSFRHAASLLFVLAYLRLIGKKLGFIGYAVCALQAASVLLLLFYPGNISEIKRLYGYTYLTFIPFQLYLVYVVFKFPRKSEAFDLLTFGVLVAMFSALRDIVELVLRRQAGAIMVSHYGFVVLVLSASVYIVRDAFLHYNDLAFEKRRVAFFHNESRMDALTGCYNRKVIPVLEQSLVTPFSLLVLDVDDLKFVNDTHGHLAGDAILVDAARIAARDIRASDMVIRIGGDEFMVALKDCPESTARSVAQRIVRDCAASKVRIEEGIEISYSISLGVATCDQSSSPGGKALQETQEKADARLYKAKQAGKGRWCSD
jgi:diguanylate cyclase (GGDEF)-like protein